MSRGYWRTIFAVVGWLVLVGLANAQQTPSPTLKGQPVTSGQQQERPGDHPAGDQENKKQPENLLTILRDVEAAIRDLIAKPDEGKDKGEEQREKDDLEAQQEMALWAKRMFVAAVASILLSVVGIILIWTTFKATRDGNKIAKEAMIAQTRPWVRFGMMEFLSTWQPTGELDYSVRCKLENCGQSPALNVQASGEIFFRENRVGASDALRERAAAARDKLHNIEFTIFPNDHGWAHFRLEYPNHRPATPVFVYAFLCTRYRIGGDEKIHQTSRLFKFETYVPQARKYFFEPLEVYKSMPRDLKFKFVAADTAGDYAD